MDELDKNSSPKLTVAIPTRDRPDRVEGLLRTLAKQEPVPFEWEILIADNSSNDETKVLFNDLVRDFPVPLRRISVPKPGLHCGRNQSILHAKGEVLGLLDDDMYVIPTWVQGALPVLEGKAEVVMGKISPEWETSPPPWILDWASGHQVTYLGLFNLGDTSCFFPVTDVFGGNCFHKRDLLIAFGGFNPDGVPNDQLCYRGDGETGLMLKYARSGYRAYYEPKAEALHILNGQRMNLEYLCKRAYRQGVSDSFSDYRRFNALDPVSALKLKSKSRICRAKRLLKSVLMKQVFETLNRDDFKYVNAKMNLAHEQGYQFHQKCLSTVDGLSMYVLRESFLNDS